jgi:hypothetical protein
VDREKAMGATNAVVIAGNRAGRKRIRLRELWETSIAASDLGALPPSY